MRPKVLVCKNLLLPLSETFIRDQVVSLTAWTPVMVGLMAAARGLHVDGVRTIISKQGKGSCPKLQRLRDEFGIADRTLLRTLRQESASIVHAHFGTDAVKYWPLVKRLGLPFVVTLHGYDINIRRDVWEQGFPKLGNRRYPSRLISLGQRPLVYFIAVSEAIRQRAIEYGLPPDRIHVCYIGIDLQRFHPGTTPITARDPRILFVGRLVEKKGVEYLIRAFARIRVNLPDAQLVIVGDGPLAPSLKKLALELHTPVDFLGSLDSAGVRRELDRARTLCLPSVVAQNGDAEGFGMVLLEAQACGVPVITSARGGADEGIVDGTTGFRFQERDIESLVLKLQRLLTDDLLASTMSDAGPAFVARSFDLKRCTQKLEELYTAFSVEH